MPKRIMCILIIALFLGAQGVYAQGVGRSSQLTFEGTLLNYSPYSNIDYGVLYIHQVAKYRVNRVLSGQYSGDENVVDHPACDGDVFKNIPIGSQIKMTVRVWHKYLHVTIYPGIRDEEHPKIFYVAETPPMIIAHE